MQQFRHAFFAYKHFFADCIVIRCLSLSRMIRNKHNIVYVTYCLYVCSIASYRNWVHIYITPTGSDKCTQQQQQLSALSTALGSMLSVVLRAWANKRAFLSFLSPSLSVSVCRFWAWAHFAGYQHPEQHFGVARCLSLSASNAQITANWVEKRIFTNEQRARGWIGLFTTIQFQYQMRCPRG